MGQSLSEREAMERGIAYRLAKIHMESVLRTQTLSESYRMDAGAFTAVVGHRHDRPLLGRHRPVAVAGVPEIAGSRHQPELGEQVDDQFLGERVDAGVVHAGGNVERLGTLHKDPKTTTRNPPRSRSVPATRG